MEVVYLLTGGILAFFLGMLFGIWCGVAAVWRKRNPTGMAILRRWEYRVIQTTDTGVPLGEGDTHAERLTAGLDALGRDGWGLCGIAGDLMLFQRGLGDGE